MFRARDPPDRPAYELDHVGLLDLCLGAIVVGDGIFLYLPDYVPGGDPGHDPH